MNTKKPSVAIIGDGSLGKALGKAISIDPLGPSDNPVRADVVIVCVPTETVDGKHDLSQVKQALSRIKETRLVILRSTVLPGTTDQIAETLPFPIMFVPEYGYQATIDHDLAHPKSLVLGVATGTRKELIKLATSTLPKAATTKVTSRVAAEFAKYFANIWGCSQVILANSLYDWVIAQGYSDEDYQHAVEAATLHGNVPTWGWQIHHQNSRGYGGKCLPKDIQAAISQYNHPLWQTFEKINDTLR